MGRIIVRGGRLLDPATQRDLRADLAIEDDRIVAVGRDLDTTGAEVIDAGGAWVAPGFVDMHVHLREPGQEYKEDIGSGGRCAVAGGFTAVACMANTDPVNDDPSVTEYILQQARQDSPARVYPVAAATKGLKGELMTEMAALKEAGAVAFSDDGKTIMDAAIMRHVLEYSKLVHAPIIVHAEDCNLVGDGVVNEGPVSMRLGLPGNPSAAEDVHVARDVMLARMTGARLHIAHVSSGSAIEMVRRAREEGLQVTAEVTPHHLALTDEATLGFDTNAKMAPPLRSEADRQACRAGLADGVIDCIATDHAPHAVHEKEVDFQEAPPGILGLETAFPVVMDMVRGGEISPLELMRRLSTNAARILGVSGGSLEEGRVADIVVLDPARKWTYDPAKGYSKSRNSPWSGEPMEGGVVATLVGGELVYHIDRGVIV